MLINYEKLADALIVAIRTSAGKLCGIDQPLSQLSSHNWDFRGDPDSKAASKKKWSHLRHQEYPGGWLEISVQHRLLG